MFLLPRLSPLLSSSRWSPRVHEAINIITERERVGIIIADDGKNNNRKGYAGGTRNIAKQNERGRKKTERRTGSSKEVVVSSNIWEPPLYIHTLDSRRLLDYADIRNFRGAGEGKGLLRQQHRESKLMRPGHAISETYNRLLDFSHISIQSLLLFLIIKKKKTKKKLRKYICHVCRDSRAINLLSKTRLKKRNISADVHNTYSQKHVYNKTTIF